jgi:GT2 family glycosyltransferase
MTIAVVIPHYRQARFLAACLTSVLGQERVPDEIIVVDSSPEETAAIVAPFRARITYLEQPPSGVAAARNAGIRASRSELVAFLDADNEALPATALLQIQALRERGVVLCHGALVPVDESGVPQTTTDYRSEEVSEAAQLGWLLERNRIACDTVCVRRAALDRVGGFCEDHGVREDYDLWLRLSTAGGFCYVPQPLARYRRHATNLSNDEDSLFEWEGGALRRVSDECIAAALEAAYGAGAQRDLIAGEVALRAGRHGEAVRRFEAGSLRWPDEWAFAFHLGTLQLSAGDLAAARDWLHRALELEPGRAEVWNNLGVVRAKCGDLAGAREAVGRAVALNPAYRDASDNARWLTASLADRCRITRRRLRADLLPQRSLADEEAGS